MSKYLDNNFNILAPTTWNQKELSAIMNYQQMQATHANVEHIFSITDKWKY